MHLGVPRRTLSLAFSPHFMVHLARKLLQEIVLRVFMATLYRFVPAMTLSPPSIASQFLGAWLGAWLGA